ncbi:MAG: YaiI/YqxD family protein [Schwartzia sp.]|nr:YaiI/YqxD family protein [Schwartzia sp. (in: firmicutes)]MBR1760602.1 YaiI/YqxD family protein [Schwartzia sp. (in: firmicutes)]MBR1886261.1 YaiI/YqxD family protein [Schwartzia sp. (in: firmicutes)]
MKILVDADACPVVRQIEAVARKHHVPVILLCDTNHILQSKYSEVRTIGAGADAVDFALVNLCHAGDIVVTQDYGLAAMALGKKAYAVHSSGLRYTDENISRLLEERHMVKELRRSSRNANLRGIKNLMKKADGGFKAVLGNLLLEALENEGRGTA